MAEFLREVLDRTCFSGSSFADEEDRFFLSNAGGYSFQKTGRRSSEGEFGLFSVELGVVELVLAF